MPSCSRLRCENRGSRCDPPPSVRSRGRLLRGARAGARGGDALAARDAAPTRPTRERPEPDSRLRTPFQRDRDRIVHSKAFRRLKHKTQVFIAPEGDHYRTRLTHTLETCGIARTVARALRPERGPDRGDRARPRPRPSAVRAHRRGGARRLPARALRRAASATTSSRCGSSTARARRRGPQPDRAGARRDPQPHRRATAGDARGPDRAAGRPRRLHQPRHRRRRCAPASSPRATCPASEIERARRDRRERIDTLVRDIVEHSERAGDIVQSEEIGGAMLRAAQVHVRPRLPRRRPRAASTSGSSGRCARSSTTTSSIRRSCPTLATPAPTARSA